MKPTTLFINGLSHMDIENMEWKDHPKFQGIHVKNLLTSKDTDGKISIHIMKIDPHVHVPNHIHEGMAEIHEVLDGEGVVTINGIETEYRSGTISYVPENVPHEVNTKDNELIYFAKFIPALM